MSAAIRTVTLANRCLQEHEVPACRAGLRNLPIVDGCATSRRGNSRVANHRALDDSCLRLECNRNV